MYINNKQKKTKSMTHFNTALASSSLRDIDLLIATDKRTSSQNTAAHGDFLNADFMKFTEISSAMVQQVLQQSS